jgi:hypothetical protein
VDAEWIAGLELEPPDAVGKQESRLADRIAVLAGKRSDRRMFGRPSALDEELVWATPGGDHTDC